MLWVTTWMCFDKAYITRSRNTALRPLAGNAGVDVLRSWSISELNEGRKPLTCGPIQVRSVVDSHGRRSQSGLSHHLSVGRRSLPHPTTISTAAAY